MRPWLYPRSLIDKDKSTRGEPRGELGESRQMTEVHTRTGPKFGPRFNGSAEPDHKSSSRLGKGKRPENRSKPGPNRTWAEWANGDSEECLTLMTHLLTRHSASWGTKSQTMGVRVLIRGESSHIQLPTLTRRYSYFTTRYLDSRSIYTLENPEIKVPRW